MRRRPWRTACASVAGTSHASTGTPCQDAGLARVMRLGDGSEILVAGVADGAGSAPRSAQGARLATESFIALVAETARARPNLDFFDRGFALHWLGRVRAAIAALASSEGAAPEQYACTFLGAVVGERSAAFVQIGDGAIVVDGAPGGGHRWVFWPQHGEFANSTFFVTHEAAADRLEVDRADHDGICEVALFSDGIERLVLDLASRRVHSPALAPIFAWLACCAPEDAATSAVLAAYLGSDHVNRRTDDDKTLVMATRAWPRSMPKLR